MKTKHESKAGKKDLGYKANLLQNARFQMAQVGGSLVLMGRGNNRQAIFRSADGRSCTVWFPVGSRVQDAELRDLENAIEFMSGRPAFSMPASDSIEAELEKVRKIRKTSYAKLNAELISACEALIASTEVNGQRFTVHPSCEAWSNLTAAIAKAKGGTN